MIEELLYRVNMREFAKSLNIKLKINSGNNKNGKEKTTT